MVPKIETQISDLDQFVDEIVEAFEADYAREGHGAIDQFAPDTEHPFYLPVLRELVRVDLELSWDRGQRKRLEEYRQRFPELFEDPLCLQDIAFEEYRLRRQAGENPTADEYSSRFGLETDGWPEVECQANKCEDQTLTGVAVVERLGFQLISELGTGAFGRVYLAKQGELADRLVVLKISNDMTAESRSLAQLQHTNIVPVYSIHRSGAFQAVCMPYFGATTLAGVLQELRSRSSLPASGKDFLSTLDNRKNGTVVLPESTPANAGSAAVFDPAARTGPELAGLPAVGKSESLLEMIQGLSFVETVTWIIARLADGLAHAHERGILHRDLKPANVLLTDEGQPMLLDFSLSSDTKRPSKASAEFIGGTLPYMAPEHLEALQGGDRPVDARSDIFSLGVIFHELLALRHPFCIRHGPLNAVLPEMIADRQQGPCEIRRRNRAVSPALESIVRRCMKPDPNQRYQSARQLQEDLDRQLQNLPLKHAPDHSMRERFRKWVRRHPRLASSTSVATLALLVILALTGWSLLRGQHLARLEAMQSWIKFREDVKEVHNLLNVPGWDRRRLDEGTALCRRALKGYEVLTNSLWQESDRVRSLPDADQNRLREELGELLFLLAGSKAKQAELELVSPESTDLIQEALRLNALADSCHGTEHPPRALRLQRAELLRMSGDAQAAESVEQSAIAVPLRSATDFYLLGAQFFSHGEFHQAISFLKQANQQAPQDFSVWMVLGNCHAGLGEVNDAIACYSACLALWPDSHWPYFNRGLAHLDLGQYEQAYADFSRAIELRPDQLESHINRGLSRLALNDHAGAIKDFTHALDRDGTHVRVYFMLAQSRELAGDPEGAARDRQEGLRREPTDELSWIARGVAQLPTDPAAALSDFDHALQLNPHSREALQDKAHVLSERLGRVDEAIAVLDLAVSKHPDYVPARAGRGVLLARCGKREAAHRDAEEVLARDSKPGTLYQVAGIYALTTPQNAGDRTEALRLLATALRQDPRWLQVVPSDGDLDNIRNDQEFRHLIEVVSELAGVPPAAVQH